MTPETSPQQPSDILDNTIDAVCEFLESKSTTINNADTTLGVIQQLGVGVLQAVVKANPGLSGQAAEPNERDQVVGLIGAWLKEAKSVSDQMNNEDSSSVHTRLNAEFWTYRRCALQLSEVTGESISNLRDQQETASVETPCPTAPASVSELPELPRRAQFFHRFTSLLEEFDIQLVATTRDSEPGKRDDEDLALIDMVCNSPNTVDRFESINAESLLEDAEFWLLDPPAE